MNANKLLIIAAGVCFLLAAASIHFGRFELLPLGLAFYMASKLA